MALYCQLSSDSAKQLMHYRHGANVLLTHSCMLCLWEICTSLSIYVHIHMCIIIFVYAEWPAVFNNCMGCVLHGTSIWLYIWNGNPKETQKQQTHTLEHEVYIYIHTLHKSHVQKLTFPETPRTNNLKSMHGSTQICDFVHMSFSWFWKCDVNNVVLNMWISLFTPPQKRGPQEYSFFNDVTSCIL